MDPTTLVLQTAGGFVAGGLIGYAIRKITKWVLVGMGLMLLPIAGLWQCGVINVNWEGLNELIGRIVYWLGINLTDMGSTLVSAGAFGISGLLGFLFGISGGFKHSMYPIECKRRFVRRKN